MSEDIRWKQRFQNLENAFLFLQKLKNLGSYDDIQTAALIKSFEIAFELSWKTLKDYLERMGTPVKYPREVIKNAFATNLIENGNLWIMMLDKRNELSHVYDEEQAQRAIKIIRDDCFPGIEQVYHTLKGLYV